MKEQTTEKAFLGVTVDKSILEAIDRQRGLVKRSTFVNDLLHRSILVGGAG